MQLQDELKNALERGCIILCEDIAQRRNALMYLQGMGYKIGDYSKRYIAGDTDDGYLNHGMENGKISCWVKNYSGRKETISYDIFAPLFEPEISDGMNANKFSTELKKLLFV